MVNVVPSTEPQDAYKVVAEAAAPNCPESIKPFMNRKIVKRVVMTIPYNSKPYSNRQYIKDALKDAGWEGEYQDILDASAAVKEAMESIFPGPMKVMTWIEEEVSKAIKRGATELNWVTPSGFNCRQLLNKHETTRLELKLLGSVTKQTISKGPTDKVDLKHHKNATAPNLIHSLDADLIRLAALEFEHPIGLIHDSVLCRATDMSELSSIVRKTYMHLFAEHDFLRTFAEQIGAETEPPIIGDLEPEKVIHSTYFFC
jgi:DNA-directed RNA polymerase